MKILYFTDGYAEKVMGTKISIATELKKYCEVVILQCGQITQILNLIEEYAPDMVWLVHTGLKLSKQVKDKIKIPVVGVGMSDPYMQEKVSLESYDVYITNHDKTFGHLKDRIFTIYNQTACDFLFHKDLELEKTIDVSIIGLGTHIQWGTENSVRIDYATKLRGVGVDVKAYGQRWNAHPNNFQHIEGSAFLDVINKTKLGLDIQADFAPLAHRMFEYSACGTPVLTRRRSEVYRVFKEDEEILMYDNYSELEEKVLYYLGRPLELQKIGNNAKARCNVDHNVSNRVAHIVKELKMNNFWR